MEPIIRKFLDQDINYVMDIDLKSYFTPFTLDEWRAIADDATCELLVATCEGVPVGVVIWRKNRKEKEGEIVRLGVKPCERNSGIGSQLLEAVEYEALRVRLDKLYMVVPEVKCSPGDPDDVSVWLRVNGFRATLPIIPAVTQMYGRSIDGYRFEKPVRND